MLRNLRFWPAVCAVAFAVDLLLCAAPAPAEVNVFVGSRHVVENTPVSDCTTRAQSALKSVLGSASGSSDGWTWLGYGPPDSSGSSSYGAAIHCYQVGTGYVVTITCAVGLPPSPYVASAVCAKVDAAFGLPTTAAPAATGSPQ